MSSYTHGPHKREEGRPLLCDGCPACEDHAEKRGVGLDEETFRAAWRLMIAVEYGNGASSYRSSAEAKLCRALYETSLVIQRFFGIDPRLLVVV